MECPFCPVSYTHLNGEDIKKFSHREFAQKLAILTQAPDVYKRQFYMYCMSKQFTVIMVTRPENFDAVRRTGQIHAATLAEAWTLAQKKLMAQGKAERCV